MATAAPAFSLWPLAWIALAPLWVLVLKSSTWQRSLLYGLVWGLGYYGGTLAWITYLHPLMWMGIPWAGSIAIAGFAWGVVTFWGTACVGFWAVGLNWLADRGPRWVRLLGGVALWSALETLRSCTPLDWSPLALTQSPDNLLILQLSQFSGQGLVSGLIVAVNGLLAEGWWQRRYRAGDSPSGGGVKGLAIATLGLLTVSHLTGAVLFLQESPVAPGAALQLGLIQGNIPTREKLTLQGIQQASQRYTEGYRQLVDQGAAAVITPEGAIPAVWDTTSAQSTGLIQAVRQTGVPLWLGTFARDRQQPQRLTQSLLAIGGEGTVQGRYDKVKLVPLGEYLPLETLLGGIIGRLSPLDSYLVPGNPHQQFRTSLGPAIVGICYESAYGELFRRQTAQGGEFIVTTSNNDPYPPWMMAQHHALDVIRAIESDRWAARVTNTGLSGLVDAQGRTRWLSQPNTYGQQLVAVERRRTLTPYGRLGNWWGWGCLITCLGGWAIARR